MIVEHSQDSIFNLTNEFLSLTLARIYFPRRKTHLNDIRLFFCHWDHSVDRYSCFYCFQSILRICQHERKRLLIEEEKLDADRSFSSFTFLLGVVSILLVTKINFRQIEEVLTNSMSFVE